MMRFKTLRRLLVSLTLALGLCWGTLSNGGEAHATSLSSWAKVLWTCQTPGPRVVDPNQQKMDALAYFRPGVNKVSQQSVSTYMGTNLGRCIGEIVLDSIGGKPVMVITGTAIQIRNYQYFVTQLASGTSLFSKVVSGGSCSACTINPFETSGS
jgi:hypothetical protein